MRLIDELAERRRFGIQPGLESICAACHALGDPQKSFPAVHVAGTNGKGAVTAILDACLRRSGRKVGRYTSPHLVNVNERFFLDGLPVADDVLDRFAAEVCAALPPAGSELTFFEFLTAVAFRLYAAEKVDVGVLECGLGGRLDATNVCEPRLCVITRIGLDHCAWLGDTVEKIAVEKAGIVKPGVPVVLGRNEEVVRRVIEARAHERGAPFHYAPDLVSEDAIPADFPLSGSFNRENAVTALAALEILNVAPQGFGEVVWPGRFHRIGRFVVDGAHNPPAARALADSLVRERLSGLDLIAGFCADKDAAAVLETLRPFVRRGYAVRTNNPRSLSAEETAGMMSAAGIAAQPCETVRAALDASTGATLVCGSLFLAGEALVELDAYPWGRRRFDLEEG